MAPSGILSASTTADGIGIAFTFSEAATLTNPDITVTVNGSQRWTAADATDLLNDGTTVVTLVFAVPAISHGDTVSVVVITDSFIFATSAVPTFSGPVTNTVP